MAISQLKKHSEDLMHTSHFRPVMLLAILIPLLITSIGYYLMFANKGTKSQNVAESFTDVPDSIFAYKMIDEVNSSTQEPEKGFGIGEISLYLSLLFGCVAFLWFYLRSSLVWVAIIAIPIFFSLWVAITLGISIIPFYLLSLLFAVLFALLVRHLFFWPPVLRFRMVLCSIVGAALLTLYYRGIFWVTSQECVPSWWSNVATNSLIAMIFITFGLSMADLVILRKEISDLNKEKRRRALADEDEDDNNAD